MFFKTCYDFHPGESRDLRIFKVSRDTIYLLLNLKTLSPSPRPKFYKSKLDKAIRLILKGFSLFVSHLARFRSVILE